jgi:hypothetical protein
MRRAAPSYASCRKCPRAVELARFICISHSCFVLLLIVGQRRWDKRLHHRGSTMTLHKRASEEQFAAVGIERIRRSPLTIRCRGCGAEWHATAGPSRRSSWWVCANGCNDGRTKLTERAPAHIS